MVPIKVLIVDDHSIVREGLKALLELEPGICVMDEANNAMEAVRKTEASSPDLVLMDLKMPGISGIEACRLIKKNSPHVKVVMLTNYEDKEFVHEALKAQADGYVLKNVKKGDLPMIIKTTMQGGAYLDPMVTRKALDRLAAYGDDASPPTNPNKLTQRELQILLEVVAGASNKEIALHSNLSLDTVKTHLRNIYAKLEVRSRSQAIKVAMEQKLISMPV